MNITKYFAYSKINLGLQVLNKRNDGYHNINTVFYRINLCDEMEFSMSEDIIIEADIPLEIPQKENLIYKAGKLVLDYKNIQTGFKVVVNKRIPVGAGLGGGSSDAATTIIALNDLYDMKLSPNEIIQLASIIGSDCAFFAAGCQSALGTGRGDIITPFDFILNNNIVLVNPGIHVSTPFAYKSLERGFEETSAYDFKQTLEKFNTSLFKDYLINDFEPTIFKLYPEIADIKTKLYYLGADFALMSGSGSTVFALFPKLIETKELNKMFPNFFMYNSKE
ncbi:4-(cytidine 5'-diphospho)-2-C-methyl-D-erythritol kinase [Candidatus Kapaibacterium sp.]